MINSVFEKKNSPFKWVDVQMPDGDDYHKLAKDFDLHPAYVKDCMEPFHLPKIEFIDKGSTVFILTRAYDENAKKGSETVQQLTNKIAMFITQDAVITIHRAEEPFIVKIRNKWLSKPSFGEDAKNHFCNDFLEGIISTYFNALSGSTQILDDFEQRIFKNSKDSGIIRELYEAKRRASIYKRMLFLSKDIIHKYARRGGNSIENLSPFDKDLMETVDKSYFLSDDLHENVNNLLNLHLSLASHRTNEVMSILTMFSVFFMPITFIVGVYGMNFENMPELKTQNGYFFVWGLMILSALGIYWMFKKRRWL